MTNAQPEDVGREESARPGEQPEGEQRAEGVREGGQQPGAAEVQDRLDGPPRTGHQEVDGVLAGIGDLTTSDPAEAQQKLADAHESLHGIIQGRSAQ